MIAGMSDAESDRRRQISTRQQSERPDAHTTLSEMMDLGMAVCPAFARQPDFRKYALKNLKNKTQSPVFKVSVTEIYESSRVKPMSFTHHQQQQGSTYGRKREETNKLPATRARYVPIHSSC
jgi:hypothetical protein